MSRGAVLQLGRHELEAAAQDLGACARGRPRPGVEGVVGGPTACEAVLHGGVADLGEHLPGGGVLDGDPGVGVDPLAADQEARAGWWAPPASSLTG